ncbi:MAG: nuclear transport factor 2 family protein [Myxococcota bacterium]
MIREEDRSAIGELLSRYCHSIDAPRGDLCGDLFTDDAVLETPVGRAEGISAIREWIDGRLALRQDGIQVRHLLLNTLLAEVEPDLVRVRSTLLYTWESLEMPREVSVKSTVIYEDVVRRTSRGWLFSARRCETQLPLDDVYFR